MLKHRPITWICGLCFLLFLVMFQSQLIPGWTCFTPLILWLILSTIGSFHIRWNYFLRSLHKTDGAEDLVAITFDDGPHPEFTPRAMDLLEEYGMKGTFFCIGKHVDKHPELARSIVERGHTIGNHSHSHSRTYGFRSSRHVAADIKLAQQSILNATQEQSLLFRPPFGVTNPHIARAVQHLELTSIGWNARSLDTTSRSEDQVYQRIEDRLQAGCIILLHDTSDKTMRVLERLLVALQERKWSSTTVDQLLNIKSYA